MKSFFKDKKFNIIASVTAIALAWLVWFIAAISVKNEALVPPIDKSIEEFFKLFSMAFFWRALGRTTLRTLIAFLISFACALVCVVPSCRFKWFTAFMRPIVAILRSVPTMAVLLLVLVWLAPTYAPVAVTFLVLFPTCYTQLKDGVEGVDSGLLDMAKAYKLTRKTVLGKIYLPTLVPQVISQTGANLSFAIKLIISAEVMSSTSVALGGMMSESIGIYTNYSRLAALTLFAVLFGIVVEIVFATISKYAFPWVRRCGGDN